MRLRACPATRQAWLDGTLSGGQVQAILANVPPATAVLYAEHESELVARLAPLSVTDTAHAMQSWKAHAEAVIDEGEAPTEPRRVLRLSRLLDGRAELQGSLDPEAAAVVETALRLATSDETGDTGDTAAPAASERRGDALVAVCRWFLDHQHEHRDGRNRPHVNVVVDLDQLAAEGGGQGRLIDGTPLDPPTVRRILCDAGVHRLVTVGGSTVLDYGRRTRVVSPDLWAALMVRDRHCRAPGCDRPARLLRGPPCGLVDRGRRHRPRNLALLCSRHHHRFHQPGWHVKLLPDATLEVTSPTGRVRTSSPAPGR